VARIRFAQESPPGKTPISDERFSGELAFRRLGRRFAVESAARTKSRWL